MQLVSLPIFLALCLPFLLTSSNMNKNFSILFFPLLLRWIFFYIWISFLHRSIFIAMYLNLFKRSKALPLLLSFISFAVGSYTGWPNLIYVCTNNDIIFRIFFNDDRTLVFIDPTISEGMKNIALFSTYLSVESQYLYFLVVQEFIKLI